MDIIGPPPVLTARVTATSARHLAIWGMVQVGITLVEGVQIGAIRYFHSVKPQLSSKETTLIFYCPTRLKHFIDWTLYSPPRNRKAVENLVPPYTLLSSETERCDLITLLHIFGYIPLQILSHRRGYNDTTHLKGYNALPIPRYFIFQSQAVETILSYLEIIVSHHN